MKESPIKEDDGMGRMPLRKKVWIGLPIFAVFVVLLFFSLSDRLCHSYLEDDLLWMIPQLTQLQEAGGIGALLLGLHTGELTFTDGWYLFLFQKIFSDHFRWYTLILIILHVVNSLLLYFLLSRRMAVSGLAAFMASLIYLSFYGQFHGLTFVIAFHHLTVVFFFLLILQCYLKTDERVTAVRPFAPWYWCTILLAVPASVQRLSILILPLMMLAHILLTGREKKEILRKSALWLPVFTIFLGYQLFVFLVGNQGDVLSRFLEPLSGLAGMAAVSPLLLGVSYALAFAAVWLLQGVLTFVAGIPLARFCSRWIGRLIWVVLLFPHLLVLTAGLFILPLSSALDADVISRWHRLPQPADGGLLTALTAGVVVILFFFLLSCRRNRSLSLFLVWYAAVVLYFWGYGEDVPSRYFIYLSPVWATILSFFFLQTLPGALFIGKGKTFRRTTAVVLGLFCLLNLSAIKVRSAKTLLVDYHWSYDYIKAAHVIGEDLAGEKSPAVCVQNVPPIPYKDNWEKGFLRAFDFERRDGFRHTFRSVVGPDVALTVNAACPAGVKEYWMNPYTVVDGEGHYVEPFYRAFHDGKRALHAGDNAGATILLEQAVAAKPFLLQFVSPRRWWGRALFERQVTEVVYGVYTQLYDGDRKINALGHLIRTEAHDYAVTLMLLAFLRQDDPSAAALMEEAALYISPHQFRRYLRRESLKFPKLDAFTTYIDQNLNVFKTVRHSALEEDVESYHGYTIFKYKEYYFAQPIDQGEFTLEHYQSETCSFCFAAKTRRELRQAIDAAVGRNRSLAEQKNVFEDFVSYKEFWITRIEDIYYCLSDSAEATVGGPGGGRKGLRPVELFQSQSLAEARQTLAMYSRLLQEISSDRAERSPAVDGPEETGSLSYRISWMGVPLGHVDFTIDPLREDGWDLHHVVFEARPPALLQFLSSGRLGMNFSAWTETTSRLPLRTEYNHLYGVKKGKAPKRTVYHHQQMYMERRGKEEDIRLDTRDLASFLLWLMGEDYAHKKLVKTTLNWERELYVAVGMVTPQEKDYRLDMRLAPLYASEERPDLPVTVFLKETRGIFVPLKVEIGHGLSQLRLQLHTR